MRETFDLLMKKGLGEFGIGLSQDKLGQFYRYYELLIEWNKVMNLTSIVEMEDVVRKHFVDSLTVIKVLCGEQEDHYNEWKMNLRILDLGTGAGFPGVPIKIAIPEAEIVLLDSLNKRIQFLNDVIRQLGLHGITAVHGRAEDFGRSPLYRESFDLCVSRAVANLSTLSEYCIPFVKSGGYFVAYKSGKAENEIQEAKGALKLLGGGIDRIEEFVIPDSDIERMLVKIKKTENTSKKYPRKAGIPGKEPLK